MKHKKEPESFVESLFVEYTPQIASGISVKKKKDYYRLRTNSDSVITKGRISKRLLDFLKDSGINIDVLQKDSFAPVKEIKRVPVEIMSTAWDKKNRPKEVLIRISANDEETLYARKKKVMAYLTKLGATPTRSCHWICTTKLAEKSGA